MYAVKFAASPPPTAKNNRIILSESSKERLTDALHCTYLSKGLPTTASPSGIHDLPQLNKQAFSHIQFVKDTKQSLLVILSLLAKHKQRGTSFKFQPISQL